MVWAPDRAHIDGKLLQSQMEKAMGQLDSKLKGCIKMMTKRAGKNYDSFKKDSVFVLRVMAAHLVLKKQAFFAAQKAGRTPKSHPPWAVEAYKKMDDEGDLCDDHIGDEQPRAKKNKSTGSSSLPHTTSPATTLQEKILEGRKLGVAVFPSLESDADDQEEPTPPPPPKPPKTNTTSSTRSVYWDPKLKKAVAILQDGSTKHSTNIKVGPNGFLLAEWKIDLNIEPYELEITNDQIGVLEVAVVHPIVFKKPAKINIKRKADTIMEAALKAETEGKRSTITNEAGEGREAKGLGCCSTSRAEADNQCGTNDAGSPDGSAGCSPLGIDHEARDHRDGRLGEGHGGRLAQALERRHPRNQKRPELRHLADSRQDPGCPRDVQQARPSLRTTGSTKST